MGLYKRGRIWWVTFALEGRRVSKSTKLTDKTTAAAWADEYKTQCRKGAVDPFAPMGPIPTVSEVLNKYLQVHLIPKSRHGWQGKYRVTTLLRHFGSETRITKIRPMLDTYLASRKANGVSEASIKRELVVLRAAVRKAIEWQWIAQDPMAGYKLPKADIQRQRYIEDVEFERLLNAAHPAISPVLIVARHTGMRQGEILELDWQNVDLKRGWLFVSRSKSGEGRPVPLTSEVVKMLGGVPLSERMGFVFKYRGKPMNRGGFLKWKFVKAVQVAGLANFRFHDLRHTFASHAAMRGVNLKTLADILGHKSTRMTERYAHLSDAHRKAAIELAAPKKAESNATILTTIDIQKPSPAMTPKQAEKEKSLPSLGRIFDEPIADAVTESDVYGETKSNAELEANRSKETRLSVPPTGFEPVIFALRGQRPKPLDDEGTNSRLNFPATTPHLCLERAAS